MNELYESATETQKLQLEAWYDSCNDELHRYWSYSSKTKQGVCIRNIGNMIFDMKGIKILDTGSWSEELVDTINELLKEMTFTEIPKDQKPCIEHFLPRNDVGKLYINVFKDHTPSFEEFCNFMLLHARYHHTTKEENQKLRGAKDNGANNWVEGYDMFNIVLCDIEKVQGGRGNRILEIKKVRRHESKELLEAYPS